MEAVWKELGFETEEAYVASMKDIIAKANQIDELGTAINELKEAGSNAPDYDKKIQQLETKLAEIRDNKPADPPKKEDKKDEDPKDDKSTEEIAKKKCKLLANSFSDEEIQKIKDAEGKLPTETLALIAGNYEARLEFLQGITGKSAEDAPATGSSLLSGLIDEKKPDVKDVVAEALRSLKGVSKPPTGSAFGGAKKGDGSQETVKYYNPTFGLSSVR